MTTAAVARARANQTHRQPQQYQRAHRGRDYVECPVCHIPTGSFTPNSFHGFLVVLNDNASGKEDGTRCRDHRRTPRMRRNETRRAMRWIAQNPIESQLVHE